MLILSIKVKALVVLRVWPYCLECSTWLL